ncbi:MAG: hypothetical protein ACP5E4_00710 [Candidatus Aenigmatarchaeota archaeon]
MSEGTVRATAARAHEPQETKVNVPKPVGLWEIWRSSPKISERKKVRANRKKKGYRLHNSLSAVLEAPRNEMCIIWPV